MRRTLFGIVLLVVIAGWSAAQADRPQDSDPAFQQASGQICVAPYPEPICGVDGCLTGYPEFSCTTDNVSLKIDSRKPVPWPKKGCMKVDGLATNVSHRVTLLCENGKPQQSFKFRFSQFKTNNVCLWVNDLYRSLQLWGLDEEGPWCKCKDAAPANVSEKPVQTPRR